MSFSLRRLYIDSIDGQVLKVGSVEDCPCIHYMSNNRVIEIIYTGLPGYRVANVFKFRQQTRIRFDELVK